MPENPSVSVPTESRPTERHFADWWADKSMYPGMDYDSIEEVAIKYAEFCLAAAYSSLLPVPETRFPQKWSEDAFVLLAGLRNSVIWELAPQIVKEITRLVEEALALPELASLPVGESREPGIELNDFSRSLAEVSLVPEGFPEQRAGNPYSFPRNWPVNSVPSVPAEIESTKNALGCTRVRDTKDGSGSLTHCDRDAD